MTAEGGHHRGLAEIASFLRGGAVVSDLPRMLRALLTRSIADCRVCLTCRKCSALGDMRLVIKTPPGRWQTLEFDGTVPNNSVILHHKLTLTGGFFGAKPNGKPLARCSPPIAPAPREGGPGRSDCDGQESSDATGGRDQA